MPEGSQAGGPIDHRRFVGLFGERRQPRERDQHDEGRPLPHVDQRERVEGRPAAVGPRERGEAGAGHQVVHHPERRVVHHDKDERDRGRRRHHREDGERPDQPPAPELPVEQQGHRPPEDCLRRDDQQRKVEGPKEGVAEPRVGDQDLPVMGDADEPWGRQAGGEPLLEAHPPGVEHRVHDDEAHQDDGGRREDQGGVPVGEPRDADPGSVDGEPPGQATSRSCPGAPGIACGPRRSPHRTWRPRSPSGWRRR